MHMADARISPAVGVDLWAACGGRNDCKVPLRGVLGAFVFAPQMINVSLPGTGSSGHNGAGLLGFHAALLTSASELLVQALFAGRGLPARQDTALHRRYPRATVLTFFIFIFAVMSFARYAVSALVPFFLFSAARIGLLNNFRHTPIIVSQGLAMVADLCERTIVLHESAMLADCPTAGIFRDKALLTACRPQKPLSLQGCPVRALKIRDTPRLQGGASRCFLMYYFTTCLFIPAL